VSSSLLTWVPVSSRGFQGRVTVIMLSGLDRVLPTCFQTPAVVGGARGGLGGGFTLHHALLHLAVGAPSYYPLDDSRYTRVRCTSTRWTNASACVKTPQLLAAIGTPRRNTRLKQHRYQPLCVCLCQDTLLKLGRGYLLGIFRVRLLRLRVAARNHPLHL